MAKNGQFIGFRWHPGNEAERKAMQIYAELMKQEGANPRAIFTEAILKMQGQKLELYDSTKIVTKNFLEDLLSDFASHLLREMRSMSFVSTQQTDNELPITSDEDDEYAKNLAAGFMARRKR